MVFPPVLIHLDLDDIDSVLIVLKFSSMGNSKLEIETVLQHSCRNRSAAGFMCGFMRTSDE